MNNITMTPAYGRDYKSINAAKKSWHSGEDWIINDISSRWDGKPANCNDIKTTVKLRFSKLTKVCMS